MSDLRIRRCLRAGLNGAAVKYLSSLTNFTLHCPSFGAGSGTTSISSTGKGISTEPGFIRDLDALACFLDDDVVWTISGPVDILTLLWPPCRQGPGDEAARA